MSKAAFFKIGREGSANLPLPKKAALDLCQSKHPVQVPSRGPPAPSADMTAESEPAVAAGPIAESEPANLGLVSVPGPGVYNDKGLR